MTREMMIDFFDNKQKTGNQGIKAADNPAAPAAIKKRFHVQSLRLSS